MPSGTTVACYYFPNYHVDPRNERAHGQGWTEWELVKRAEPRFPGHRQPLVPAWGYEDEADPAVMARKIDAAADHGVDAFIYDWYYYDDGPFLGRALEQGFMPAVNTDRLKFALMWANHNWTDIHPAKLAAPPHLQFPGKVSPQTFDRMTDTVIEKYFRHPAYWTIDGCPYFSIYELYRLIESFGTVAATRDALERFRQKTRAAGFRDLHLNAVVWGLQILPGETVIKNPAEMVAFLGCDSVTSYVWIHHIGLPDFPTNDYRSLSSKAAIYWRQAVAEFPVPYYPNVSMGWDSSPRTVPSDRYMNMGYPCGPVVVNNTPEAFGESLRQAQAFMAARPANQRILTVNAWNEWTEGSYLEPDTVYGMRYLEAIRDVFGVRGM